MKYTKNNSKNISKSNNNVKIETPESNTKINNRIPLSISLKKDLVLLIYVLAIALIILLITGMVKPQGNYTYSGKNHQLIKITLKDDGTFTSYDASDADMGGFYYYGTYKKKGALILNYEKLIINADDFEIEDDSSLKAIGDNKYEKKIKKTGYAIVIGNRLISFKNPQAILKKD